VGELDIKAIEAALADIPAPPWQWIGTRNADGPMLATTHSGWEYLMGLEHGEDHVGERVFADLSFRDKREGDTYAVLKPSRELAVGRTEYDPDTIRGIDNPIARWIEKSAEYAAALIARVRELEAQRDAALTYCDAVQRAQLGMTNCPAGSGSPTPRLRRSSGAGAEPTEATVPELTVPEAAMGELDLNAIEARSRLAFREEPCSTAEETEAQLNSAADVPRLIARVRELEQQRAHLRGGLAQLRAILQHNLDRGDQLTARVRELEAQRDKALAVHRPTSGSHPICTGCGCGWPCATARALGVEAGEPNGRLA
jgi:hypothetical protein